MSETETSKSAAVPSIRTMRDDLREAKKTPSQPPQAFKAPVRPPAPPSPGSIGQRKSFSATPSAPKSPLQPQLPAPVPPEEAAKKRPDKILVILVAIFVVSALAAGGVWVWIFVAPKNMEEPIITQDTEVPKTLSEVIPGSSLLVGYYQVTEEAQRTAAIDFWHTGDPTMREALNGDPRLFLELSSVQQFAYVLLPGDPRLYVVVQNTPELEQMLAERSNVQSLVIGEWQVLHSFSTDLYTKTLAEGTWSDQAQTVQSFGKPLTLYATSELTAELHDQIGMVTGGVDRLAISIDFEDVDSTTVVRFTAESDANPAFAPGPDISEVIAHIPSDATFIRTGAAFSDQAYRVESPAGTELLTSLSKPYAYYERLGNDGVIDAGVVVSLPTELTGSLAVPDSTIEELLPTLHTAAGLGEEPAVQLAFTDTLYADVPVRFVNIDTPTLALDYTILDGFLGLATSREGMFALIDVFQGTLPGGDTTWGTVEELSRDLGASRAFGLLTQPAIKRLLPGGEAQTAIPFGIAFDTSQEAAGLAGVLVVPQAASE